MLVMKSICKVIHAPCKYSYKLAQALCNAYKYTINCCFGFSSLTIAITSLESPLNSLIELVNSLLSKACMGIPGTVSV